MAEAFTLYFILLGLTGLSVAFDLYRWWTSLDKKLERLQDKIDWEEKEKDGP